MTISSADLLHEIEAFRNGTNEWHKHTNGLAFSDGVLDVVRAVACVWLVDLIASGFAPVFRVEWAKSPFLGYLKIESRGSAAGPQTATMSLENGQLQLHSENISSTHFPEGDWMFYLMIEDAADAKPEVFMLLPSEY